MKQKYRLFPFQNVTMELLLNLNYQFAQMNRCRRGRLSSLFTRTISLFPPITATTLLLHPTVYDMPNLKNEVRASGSAEKIASSSLIKRSRLFLRVR